MTATAASIYVHIPWCLKRCPYCDFNTYAAQEWPEEEYTDALVEELAWYADRAPFRDSTVATVFFGGGTPSLFRPETIERILSSIRAALPVANEPEVTLEANPGRIDQAHFEGILAAGVNRLSVGIQTFQPRLLKALGRQHSVDESRAALRAARQAGFENLSLDLMYAAPTQTPAELQADLAEAIALAPEHISAYALTYEPGTPLTRDLESGRVQRVPDDVEAEMFETVRNRLADAGYAAYEVSNHARPGHEARHNQAYWRGGPYLGLGAGAHSYAPEEAPVGAGGASHGVRWQNVRDPTLYRSTVAEKGNCIAEHEQLTRAQAMGEFCWLALREARGLSPDDFRARFGVEFETSYPHVASLLSEGLLEDRHGRVALTREGLLLADSLFASFF